MLNERIRELAEQAYINAGYDREHELFNALLDSGAEFHKKFTELIVKECVLEAMDAEHHNASIRLQLYKHFGVE